MQRIKDFKFGMLYRCSDLRALAPWAQRIDESNPRHQNYNVFLLHRNKDSGELYLIDTFHIRNMGLKNDSYQWFIDEIVDNTKNVSSSSIREMMHDCCYNASVPLNSDNAHLFEEILYLPEWRFVRGDSEEYNSDDVARNVWLWWECCYRQGGACLIRKDAKVDTACQVGKRARAARQDMTFPYASGFSMRKLREFIAELPDDAEYDRVEVEKIEAMFEKLSDMEREWDAFYADLKRESKAKRATMSVVK